MPFQIVNQRWLEEEYAVPTPALLLCVQRGSIPGFPNASLPPTSCIVMPFRTCRQCPRLKALSAYSTSQPVSDPLQPRQRGSVSTPRNDKNCGGKRSGRTPGAQFAERDHLPGDIDGGRAAIGKQLCAQQSAPRPRTVGCEHQCQGSPIADQAKQAVRHTQRMSALRCCDAVGIETWAGRVWQVVDSVALIERNWNQRCDGHRCGGHGNGIREGSRRR